MIAAHDIEYGVSEEDDREDKEEMAENDTMETIGLQRTSVLLVCLNFVSREEGNKVCDEEGNERKPIEGLVNDEGAD